MITDKLSAHDVTEQDILDLIASQQVELNELEFKRNSDSDLPKAACAIANSGGGFIVIGIDEDKKHRASLLAPILDAESVADGIRQRLRDSLTPRPVIEVVVLNAGEGDIIVIRVAPQGPPHMVSAEKRTDFYGRYSATTEKMRYEEIERRFFERLSPEPQFSSSTPQVTIQTTLGRRDVSAGAAGALAEIERQLSESLIGEIGMFAVSDGNKGSISEDDATMLLREPTYARHAGWIVSHPTLPIVRRSGAWVQDFEPTGELSVNSSGDVLFRKTIDTLLCWRQEPEDFVKSPRIYSNTLIEFCLSFSYMLADIAISTLPDVIMVRASIRNGAMSHLPLGEAGSVWFDAPVQLPNRLGNTWRVTATLSEPTSYGKPIPIRRLAFQLAAEVYGMYGYSEEQVPFSKDGRLTFEEDTPHGNLATARNFVQGALNVRLRNPREDFASRTWWFDTNYRGIPREIVFGRTFLVEIASNEARLFEFIDATELQAACEKYERVVLTTDGVRELG